MEIHFLGTGSAYPSPKRCASCIAFRHEQGMWLFDCGEGSQIQLQKSTLRAGRITKIFITHMHGDHLFGLPGLLCTIGMNNHLSEQHVDIYGPFGIRNFIRTSLTLSYSNLPYTFAVHEISLPSYEDFRPDSVSCDHEYWRKLKDISQIELPLHPNEIPGTKINLNDTSYYEVCKEGPLTVSAGFLKHTIPCLGYVIQEGDLPGKLDVSILKQKGVPSGPLFGKIKAGASITLDNGTVIAPEECVGPKRKGRKIVIFGDTCNSDSMIDLAYKPDVLVHEATNENADEEKSVLHGHSSAGMTGAFAHRIKARQLVLTHFSQRYRSLEDNAKEGQESVAKLIEEAKKTFQSNNVIAANDLAVIQVPLPK